MWQCPACEYWNDEPAQRCERCQAERDEEPPQPAAVNEPGDLAPRLSASLGAARERRRWSPLERVALVVIVICALLLAGFAVVLWRGGFNLQQLTGRSVVEPGQAGTSSDGTVAGAPEVVQDPLAAIYTDKVRDLRSLRPYADALKDYEAQVNQLAVPEFSGGQMSTETADYLTQLNDLGAALLTSYQSFTAEETTFADAELKQYLDLLHASYAADLQDVLSRIGEIYSQDNYGMHSAYGLSDVIADAVEQVDPAQAQDLRDLWMQYVDGRQQFLLNQAQVEENRRLSALLSALQELHGTFQHSLNQLPPYSARNGLLDAAGRDTLDLLEKLATDIETTVGEYEDYIATLDVVTLSRANRDLMDRFEDLARQDHLYAFTETYRIYAQDRRLEHPAYARLGDHYAFAEEHWPELKMSYRRVYSGAEAEWAATWANK